MVDEVFKHDLTWEEKAKLNPLYAVMSQSDWFKNKNADVSSWTEDDLKKLYAKGQLIYDAFLYPIIRRGNLLPENAFIVEYGSGLGTILKVVKSAGFNCAGIDISATMLEHSRRLVPEVSDLFCLDANGHCDIPSSSADLVYSRAVLQHISELSRVKTAIDEMSRILKPGGILKLHFLTRSNLPFESHGFSGRTWVHNFENQSIVIYFGKYSGLPVIYPNIGKHTNWVGVPLSIYNLKRFLKPNGLRLLGLERDIGGENRFVWALARKERP
ncbi:MAG: class I SAM-dependent methyltransferase [Dehalococcoidales bacterium]|nr:class I SAM-dependent methyltransferase [Dehalococcoidales bacterium]